MLSVSFRNIDYAKDLDTLYRYMMKEENQILFSHAYQINSLPLFDQWITGKLARNEYHDFFMIENAPGETIGFTFSYEFFACDGHCKYTICLYDEYKNSGLGAAAGIRMMDCLFRKYPLRQIFISVFDYNKNSLEINRKGGFTEVGVLPDYRYSDGAYASLHILTMSRQDFYGRYKNIAEKLRV